MSRPASNPFPVLPDEGKAPEPSPPASKVHSDSARQGDARYLPIAYWVAVGVDVGVAEADPVGAG